MTFLSRCCTLWHTLSNRWLYLAGTLVIAALYGAALYLQHILRQEPCPLCMIQRFIFIAMLIVFFIAAAHNPVRIKNNLGAKIYGAILTLLAISGVSVAGRHIWIQNLPKDEVPACGPGLEFMVNNFPMAEVLSELLHGSGECAAKGWTFLSLGIPEWSLVWYVLLGIWAVLIAFRNPT